MSDQFAFAIIQAGLESATEEMFAVLRKTAMSPIIYEVLDAGTGITDRDGELVCSGAGIPTFIGSLDKSIKFIINQFEDNINNGDIFITNDPNYGGVSHLNDIVVAKPVFFEEQLVAWTASMAHWSDIGGKVPGSMATDATEIFAEGLRLPAVKIFDSGKICNSVMDIIITNSRQPDFTRGDLWSQIACSKIGENRILSLIQAHGIKQFNEAIEDSFEFGNQRVLQGLQKLPPGQFELEEEQDDGSLWRVKIKITSEKFLVDLRDNPPQQSGPYNTSRDGSIIACQILFKALCDPERFTNSGSFRPLEVLTRPNTIFDAGPSAPHGYYFETRIRLFDLLIQCMSRATLGSFPAGSFSSIFGTVVAGNHPDNGRKFTMVEPQMGGWGATANRNGMHAMFSISHGDTYNCPIEICEARYGLDVLHKKLGQKSDADSKFKGGRGVSLTYEIRGTVSLSAGYTRAKIPVWSNESAPVGGRNSLEVVRIDGSNEFYQFVSGLQLNKGDQICIETASGGNSN